MSKLFRKSIKIPQILHHAACLMAQLTGVQPAADLSLKALPYAILQMAQVTLVLQQKLSYHPQGEKKNTLRNSSL